MIPPKRDQETEPTLKAGGPLGGGPGRTGKFTWSFAAALLACIALWTVTDHLDQVGAQSTETAASEVPNLQLQFVNRNQPCKWDFNGLVSSFDFLSLLLRRQEAWRDLAGVSRSLIFTKEYQDRHLELMQASDLVKIVLEPGRINVLHAPKILVMMANQNYHLPLLVKNNYRDAQTLRVRTPFKNYQLMVPAASLRGYALNLNTDTVGGVQGSIELGLANSSRKIPVEFDVRRSWWLRVRITDPSPAHDGMVPAARIYLTGADGLAHSPAGAIPRITRPHGTYYFHAKDTFALLLPEGPAVIEAVRGMEYAPVRREIVLNHHQLIELELDHRFPMYQRKLYSADSHIHANYTKNEVIDIDDIQLYCSAEGLDNANFMVANSGRSSNILHDARFFEGKPHSLSKGHKVLYFNEEMRNNKIYGHISFFNLKELVRPVFTGFPGTRHYEDYPPNYNQAKGAQEQGGAVSYVHPADRAAFSVVSCRELPIDLALGQVDALDVLSNAVEVPSMEIWYRVLNCGFRCAISAGTDSFTNRVMHFVPGGGRVYVHVPGEFSYLKWIANYKKGRSFATNGPMVDLSVNGHRPGAELRLDPDDPTLKIVAEARSLVPIERLEVVANGKVVATATPKEPAGSEHHLRFEGALKIDASSWVAARVHGPGHRLVVNDPEAFAHTSPVYCIVGDKPIRSASDATFWVDWIDQLIDLVRKEGVFATSEKRDSVIDLFRRAQDVYRKRQP